MKYLFGLAVGLLLSGPVLAANFIDQDDFPTWAQEPIAIVDDAGIMRGYGDGSFGPSKLLTRAEAVTLIMRIKLDVEDNYNGIPRFPDVIKGAWYDKAIGIAANYDWVRGHDDGYFYPGNHLTRAEFSTMIERAFELDLEDPKLALKYEDINNPNQWFVEPVSAMLENELLRNALNLNYRPGEEVTRAEAAWTFAQLLGKPGLIGAEKDAEFEATAVLDSRRVAIKPRDFDANDQGFEVDRAAIHVEVTPVQVDELVDFNMGSDWTQIGVMRFTNTFEYPADLESVRLRLRLEASDMGPAEAFLLRVEGPGILIEEKLYANGGLALTGLNHKLEAEEELALRVAIKPDTDESFYMKKALGKVSVVEVSGEAFKTFQNDSRERDIRIAPIEYNSRDLSDFEFDPFIAE